jgi:membrane-bound metal-dependent hydrolase YbcI (DUF457 family)
MGPGILAKALFQGSFSLMIFGWAQLLMDLQPLIVILTGKGHIHGFSHTYIGASLIATFSAITGKYATEFCLNTFRPNNTESPISIHWLVAFISAFFGTFSHVILDSFMHQDIQPFYPFSLSNGLLGVISLNQLHKFCSYTGFVGVGLYYLIQFVTINRSHKNQSAFSLKGTITHLLAPAFCAIPIALSVGLFFEGVELFNHLTQNSLLHIYVGSFTALFISQILYGK